MAKLGPYLLAGKDLHGSTVGIFGMGAIGKAFARRLQGFNTTVLYHNRSRHEDAETELNAQYVDFDTLLQESDFVVCTAPLTDATRDQFDATAFSKMKNDAVFINIGRGAIVDEEALVKALKDGEIGDVVWMYYAKSRLTWIILSLNCLKLSSCLISVVHLNRHAMT